MMVAWWPTPAASEADPKMADGMNIAEKIVFYGSLKRSPWNNTRVVHSDPVAEVRRLKARAGTDMVILGSGTIVSLLTLAGLIDSYKLVVNPVVLGSGRTMFDGLHGPLDLHLTESRAFENGNVVLSYARE